MCPQCYSVVIFLCSIYEEIKCLYPMEPEKTEQSIFTAWKQKDQEPEYDQSEGMETLALKNENIIYTRNPVTVIIQVQLQLVRTLLSSH